MHNNERTTLANHTAVM